jgi:hypothetical protein
VSRDIPNVDLLFSVGADERWFETKCIVYANATITTDQYASKVLRNLRTKGFERTGVTEIDGQRWAILDAVKQGSGRNDSVRIYLCVFDEWGYFLIQHGPAEPKAPERKNWEKIIQSFRFPRRA